MTLLRCIALVASLAVSGVLAEARLSGLVAQDLARKAEAGDVQAQFRLAEAFESGSGAPRNAVEAERWYKAAANQGHVEAQVSLGRFYVMQKRYAEGQNWFEKAAAVGHPRATNNLGVIYDAALGVPRDRRKALGIYLTAADLGSAHAMWNIAHIHIAGQLEKPDLVTACAWATRALRFAPRSEIQLRGAISKGVTRLEEVLPPEGLARCKEAGVNWMPARVAAPFPDADVAGEVAMIRPERDP